ncbi:hypothetical protein J2X32_003036 [Rheinheimera pacifica]|nr:hypothetical protein [Rheinheimera pacifica]
MEDTNVIKFALYLEGWSYEAGDKKHLKKKQKKSQPQNTQQI